MVEAMFGMRKIDSGEVLLNGKRVDTKNPGRVMKSGIGMVQRNRKERSILPDMSIRDNLSMASFIMNHPNPLISFKEEQARYERQKKAINIKAEHPNDLITSLSGGNQQKVILGRWLELDASVYFLDNPSQGIDVGAKQEIYKIINEMGERGKGENKDGNRDKAH